MAQLNITLNQEEILQLLGENREDAFRQLLESSLNSILKAESAEQLNAAPYERTLERTGSRNGFRDRDLTTRIGTITLHIPKHRGGKPFKTMIFDSYSRSEAALVASMAEMVVNGVSTRKVTQVVETLCGKPYSKSAVSDLCKDLDKQVEEFRQRPITDRYPFMTVDATYFKVRENHRIISKAFMIAYGTNEAGIREVLGFGVYPNESKETWKNFLIDLRNRGLSGLRMVTSDAHEGIRYALDQVFPSAPWQRCQFHFSRNIADKAPKKYQAGIRAELQEMFQCKTIEDVRKKKAEIISTYGEVAEAAMRCLDEGFESSMTAMVLPLGMQRFFRTSNHIERLNKELKRRSKAIGIFPNERSLLRLMGSVLMERNELIQSSRAIFSSISFRTFMESEAPSKLVALAEEQHLLLAA